MFSSSPTPCPLSIMPDRNRIINRIAKLLATARSDGATEAEAANALRLATDLMRAHRVSEAEARQHAGHAESADDIAGMDSENRILSGFYCSNWESWLMALCCEIAGDVRALTGERAKVPRDAGGGIYFELGRPVTTRRGSATFAGDAVAVRVAGDLFEFLRLAILRIGRRRFGNVLRGAGRVYAEGFVAGLSADHEKQKKAADVADPSGGHLIRLSGQLLDERIGALLDCKITPERRRKQSVSREHAEFYMDGVEHGRQHGVARRSGEVAEARPAQAGPHAGRLF